MSTLVQNSVKVRNARLDSLEAEIGASPICRIFDGNMPASCAVADSGTIAAEGTLPSDWLSAAAAGVKAKNGTWTLTGVNTAIGRYYRIYRAGSPSECDEQGMVGPTGSPTYAMTLDNLNIASGQTVTVSSYNRTAGNA